VVGCGVRAVGEVGRTVGSREVAEGLGSRLDRDDHGERTPGGTGQRLADAITAPGVEPLAREGVRRGEDDGVVAEADRTGGGQPLPLGGRGDRPHHRIEAVVPQRLEVERRRS
jgi:hypothetical protein